MPATIKGRASEQRDTQTPIAAVTETQVRLRDSELKIGVSEVKEDGVLPS